MMFPEFRLIYLFRSQMRRQFILFATLMVAIALAAMPTFSARANTATTRYVATTGSDTGDCTSSSPCRTIQYAVNQSSSGDKILVAQGTYTYKAAVDSCSFLLTRAVVCFVDKRLTILGGYTTSNWSEANPAGNLTIIDGQNVYRGVAAIGYNTKTAHLDMEGFTIQNGLAQGPTYLTPYDPSGVGGGMLVQHAAVTLRDMVFQSNRAIGQNTSSGYGGQADGAALRIEEAPTGTTSLLQRIVFDGNQSYGGTGPERGGTAFGALFIYKTTVTVEDSVFTNNLAQGGNSTGSGVSGYLRANALGGGIGIEQGVIALRRITVTGNQAKGGNASTYGGGGYGGGIFIEDFVENATAVTLSDSYVANNIAMAGDAAQGGNAAGGGIDSADSDVTIERTSIVSNRAIGGNSVTGNAGPGAGGGLYIFADRPGSFYANIENVIVAENFAAQGSGVTSLGNGGGGGLVIHGMNANITHTTIAQNRLGSNLILGQGLLVQPWPSPLDPSLPATVNLGYSVIANHVEGGGLAAAIVVQRGSTLTFNQGMFSGNLKDTNVDNSPVSAGTVQGLWTMFSAPSAGFIAPNWPDYNYHLRLDSSAKDRATGSTMPDDVDGQSRPYDLQSDLGADEYHPFPLTLVPSSGTLYLSWGTGIGMLAGGVAHYEVLVTCETGANPPDQGNCGQPIGADALNTFTLTGLTNTKPYTVEVKAYDLSDTLIATSSQGTASPAKGAIFLPLVVR